MIFQQMENADLPEVSSGLIGMGKGSRVCGFSAGRGQALLEDGV